jgi:pimeloyl-ACP methyl ester carboxylesterase
MVATLKLDGVELAYEEKGGHGPPLLLLHGLTGYRISWDTVVPLLLDHFCVFTLDHRGHGDSSHTPGEYTVESVTTDSAHFIERVIGEPTFVWGHSMGASISLKLGVDYAPLVRSMVLEDPPLDSGIQNNKLRTLFQYWYDLGSSNLSVDEMVLDMIQELGTVGVDSFRSKSESLKKMDLSIIQLALEGALWTRNDALKQIAEMKCPSLLLQADAACGGLISEDLSELKELQTEHWSWKFYPEIGHSMHGQIPVEITRDVLKHFLSRKV